MNAATKTDRFTALLRTRVSETYGSAIATGMLGATVISGLVRGVAFQILAGQDDSVDVAVVLASLESAVHVVTEQFGGR
jgi:hypothetical protein